MAANNEVGTIEPVAELCSVAHAAGALFHVDAVQALGKIPVDLKGWVSMRLRFPRIKWAVRRALACSHLAAKTPYVAYLPGGGQENGRRSGTQNVCGISGAAAAIEFAVAEQPAYAARARAMRDDLYARLDAIKRVVPSVCVPCGSEEFLPQHRECMRARLREPNAYFAARHARYLHFGRLGLRIGGASIASHVLSALGVERNLAQGELRVSIGVENTQADIDAFFRSVQGGDCMTELITMHTHSTFCNHAKRSARRHGAGGGRCGHCPYGGDGALSYSR